MLLAELLASAEIGHQLGRCGMLAVINERIGIVPHLSLPPFEYPPLTCCQIFARPNGNKINHVLRYLLRSLAVRKPHAENYEHDKREPDDAVEIERLLQ